MKIIKQIIIFLFNCYFLLAVKIQVRTTNAYYNIGAKQKFSDLEIISLSLVSDSLFIDGTILVMNYKQNCLRKTTCFLIHL